MKSFKIILMALAGLILFAIPALNGLMQLANLTAGNAAVVLAAVSALLLFVPSKKRSHFVAVCGVEKELWVNYIIEKYYKDNQFLKFAFSDDDYVLEGKVVHIPQPGNSPTVVKNRNSFPAVAVRRGDTEINYPLDTYTTDPTHVTNAEKIEASYDKINDVYGDHVNAINETVADDMLYKWGFGLGAGSIIHTTGGPTARTADATAPSATGIRLQAWHKDVRKANLALNKQNSPKTDRFGLLDEDMADQIFDSMSDTEYRGFTQYADATTGVLGKLYNFNIMTRSSVLAASNADVVNAVGAIGAATDSAVSMFWQKNAIARALGLVKVYDDTNNPLYYGDILSMELRAGSRRRRGDDKGIILLMQGAAN